MKKLLLVLAIGSLFAVACNDGGSADTEQKTDTTAAAATVDSAAAPAAADTMAPAPAADTTKKVDTTKKGK